MGLPNLTGVSLNPIPSGIRIFGLDSLDMAVTAATAVDGVPRNSVGEIRAGTVNGFASLADPSNKLPPPSDLTSKVMKRAEQIFQDNSYLEDGYIECDCSRELGLNIDFSVGGWRKPD